jgi:hypothetical protein
MKRQFGPSLYFASDKVIFDAMNHTQVTTETIRDLLAERGVLVSPKTTKYELAQYFSRLTADYFDHQNIATRLGKIAKRERITYAEISEPLSHAEVLESLQLAKSGLEAQGNVVSIKVEGQKIVATLEYDHVDYTEVEFRQVQRRDGIVELLPDGAGKYVIRSSQNQEIDSAVDHIFLTLNQGRSVPLKAHRISLEGVPDPAHRCKFFEDLIQGIEQHTFVTVTAAYCYKPKIKAGVVDSDADKPSEVEDQPDVVRVTLIGTGVTKSFVIADLYAKGYYLVKVVWRVKPTHSLDADIFELEAQFGDPESCTEFSYQARTVLIFEDGAVTEKKRQPKLAEQDSLFRLIEAAAKQAYAGVA